MVTIIEYISVYAFNLIINNFKYSVSGLSNHLKTRFALSTNRITNSTYGCGAITDGQFKIAVQITDYTSLAIPKGTYVTVRGTVKDDCKDLFFYTIIFFL